MVKKQNSDFIIGNNTKNEELQDYIKDMSRYKVLTHEENLALAKIIQAKKGKKKEKAIKDLVCGNLRLVFEIASKYAKVKESLDFEDLIQLGNIGLIKAAEKFDPERGYKFSTMAVWWIRQGITRGIANTGSLIRLPVNKHTFVNKLQKKINNFKGELDKTAILEDLGITEKEYDQGLEIIQRLRKFQSLNQIVKNDKEENIQMIEAMPTENNIDEDYLQILRRKTINNIFQNNLFTEEQKTILTQKLLDPELTFKKLAKDSNYKEKDIKSFFEFYIKTFKNELIDYKDELI